VKIFSCKVRAILVGLLRNLNFVDIFPKKVSGIKFYQNPSSGSEVLPADGQTDRLTDTKLIVAFRNSANAPKIEATATCLQRLQQPIINWNLNYSGSVCVCVCVCVCVYVCV
jgi:hypothetical protein